MRYRVTFAAGLALGYVLGTRAGRQRYEQIKRVTRRISDSPSVQEAAGLLQAQASGLAGSARQQVGRRLNLSRRRGVDIGEPSMTSGGGGDWLNGAMPR